MRRRGRGYFPCRGINEGPYLNLLCSIQLRYGFIWSTMVGRTVGSPIEMELSGDERIIQVSGVCGTVVLQLYDRNLNLKDHFTSENILGMITYTSNFIP